MAEDAAAAERRKRAEARQAKIASRGADRLAKITGAAKGDDASERFGTGGQPLPKPASSSAVGGSSQSRPPQDASSSTTSKKNTTLPDLAAPSFDPLDDPPDIDISQQGSAALSAFPDMSGYPSNGPGGMPDMMSMLFGGAQPSEGGGGNLPPGFENIAAMMGGAPGATPVQLTAPRTKTWIDRLLPLVHLISMVSLAFYAVFVLEPKLRNGYSNTRLSVFTSGNAGGWRDIGNIDWNGWAALGRGKQAGSDSTILAKGIEASWEATGRGVASLQFLYMFLTVELMLQSAAILILKTQAPMPSLLSTIMPYLPPKFAMYAQTGVKYYALLGQFLDDLAVLVLSIAGWILFAEYKQFGWNSGAKFKID